MSGTALYTHSSDPHSNSGVGADTCSRQVLGVLHDSWLLVSIPLSDGPLCLDVGGTCSNQWNMVTDVFHIRDHFIKTIMSCLLGPPRSQARWKNTGEGSRSAVKKALASTKGAQ